jgi:hypothetical protein
LAIAAPSIPYFGHNQNARPRFITSDPAYTRRSQPVLPTMIRTNPTLPVAMLISCPAARSRRAVSPPENSEPKTRSTSSGATAMRRKIGIVAAMVQRVRFLKSLSSFSVSSLLCRSATKGLNIRLTDVRNSTMICPARSAAE